MLVRGKFRDGGEPARDFGVGIAFRTQFLETCGSIQMQDWESPNVAGFTLAVAITLSRAHSGIACEVVGDKTVNFQPVRNPGRLIAIRGRILSYRFPCYPLQRVLVERQELFEVFWIVG